MALSVIGMMVAAAGYLPPVGGAVAQEIIDVFVVANALRAGFPPKALRDF
jgi:cation transport ATPase